MQTINNAWDRQFIFLSSFIYVHCNAFLTIYTVYIHALCSTVCVCVHHLYTCTVVPLSPFMFACITVHCLIIHCNVQYVDPRLHAFYITGYSALYCAHTVLYCTSILYSILVYCIVLNLVHYLYGWCVGLQLLMQSTV